MIPERDRDVLYTRRVRHSKSVTNWRPQTRLHLVFKTFLRCPADVSFADKRLKHVSQTSSAPKLTKDVFVTKTYGSLGSDKSMRKHKTQDSQKISPFPAGDYKASRNRQDSITDINMKHKYQKDPQKKLCHRITASKQIHWMAYTCLTVPTRQL